MSTIEEKSEIIFLYESKYSMPNGDPFTGEQRYDEETKKITVDKGKYLDFNGRRAISDPRELDIYIKNTFKDRVESKDPQLERAIKELLSL